ncbi:MAG: FAD synthetase family protein [Erysipelotrichaceae bacterium]|nr:FAD synthetase family protein [Erysipelotrichaceae bacterium]
MRTVRIRDKNFVFNEQICACIGFFDGMHKGHQSLIRETVACAQRNDLKAAMICFDPDPMDLIFKKKQQHIFSLKQRKQLAEFFGIDIMIIISFDEEMMRLSAADFINGYLTKLNINELICGYDFRFAYQGKGDPRSLKRYGNFKVDIVDECKDHGKKISSTRIKEKISEGDIKAVNRLLGFDYYLLLKTVNVTENSGKWLIEAVLSDKDILIPPSACFPDDIVVHEGHFRTETDFPVTAESDIIIGFINE